MESLDRVFLVKVGLALACGGIIGLERQIRGKPAGVRTSALICLGTVIFLHVSKLLGPADPSRVLGQIVTGIGFLGAGVIITQGGLIKGLTSASVVWVLAGVGAMIGAQQYLSAMLITGLTLCLLLVMQLFERAYKLLRRGVHAHDEDQVSQKQAKEGE
ncbi:MAG: MgtC/SapB family protein [Deltaproteobacteria bacterium]|nr:MgtC/SapB family protein [Deltaproteobacteria bacterium]